MTEHTRSARTRVWGLVWTLIKCGSVSIVVECVCDCVCVYGLLRLKSPLLHKVYTFFTQTNTPKFHHSKGLLRQTNANTRLNSKEKKTRPYLQMLEENSAVTLKSKHLKYASFRCKLLGNKSLREKKCFISYNSLSPPNWEHHTYLRNKCNHIRKEYNLCVKFSSFTSLVLIYGTHKYMTLNRGRTAIWVKHTSGD